jgi:YD repeat-containing protein
LRDHYQLHLGYPGTVDWQTVFNGAPSVVYVYAEDGSHKVSSSYIDAPEGHKAELTYHYDAQGRLDQITQTGTLGRDRYTVSLGYDGQGRPNRITYPDGRVIQQAWTKAGQLASIIG